MDKKIGLGLLAVTLVALAVAFLSPGGRSVDPNPKLPWLITVDANGDSTVFGLTLGRSTLADAREVFQEQGKTSLFLSPQQEFAIEVFFQRLFLSGLRADVVLTLEVEEQLAKQIYDRGLRVSALGSGTRKVELALSDLEQLAGAAIALITYLPAADLDEEILLRHFGEPAKKITENDTGIVHWLYADVGLDIAVNPEGKEVFQYVAPSRFDMLMEPLAHASAAAGRADAARP
jgi:hypothetical protein